MILLNATEKVSFTDVIGVVLVFTILMALWLWHLGTPSKKNEG